MVTKTTKLFFVSVSVVLLLTASSTEKQPNADIIDQCLNTHQIHQPRLTNIESTNNTENAKIKTATTKYSDTIIIQKTIVSRGSSYNICITDDLLKNIKPLKMKATAYDLSVESCGKPRHHPQYGITASGVRAAPNRTVAVDPKVIRYGSILYIEFPEEYKHMNGLYIAEDTGGAIKGNKIDIFWGEDKPGERKIYEECLKFGVREVLAYVIQHGY